MSRHYGAPPTRDQVREAACPKCDADEHEPCRNANGSERESNHQERIVAHRQAQVGWRK